MPKLYGFPDPRLDPGAAEQFEADIFLLLNYNPDSGRLTWRKAAEVHKARTGRAGSKTADGTIVVTIKGRQIPAQYAAWLLHYGEQPKARLKSRKSRSNLRIANWYEEELSTHPSAANQRRLRGQRRDAKTDARMEGWLVPPLPRPKTKPVPPQPKAGRIINLYWHAWQPTGDRWKSYSLATEPPPRPLSRRRPVKGVLAEIVLVGPDLHTFTVTLPKDAISVVPAFRRTVHYAGRGAQQLMEHIAKHLEPHDTAAAYPNIDALPPSATAPKAKSAAELDHHYRTSPRRLYRTLRGPR